MRPLLLALILLPTLTLADQAALTRFLAHSSLKPASIGFCLIPIQGPDTPTLSHHPDTSLIPASTLKAVTTATALQLLGKDHQFTTRILKSGNDIIIKGGGDPTLSMTSPTSEFPAWLAALRKADLTEITGDLILDTSHFHSRTTPNSWPHGDVGNYYGAGAWGLNYHLNSYTITFKPGPVGSPAKLLRTSPTPPHVTFLNHMSTGSATSGDQGYAYSAPYAKVVTLRGTVPSGRSSFSIKGSLPNPPLSCGLAFQDYLKKNNLPLKGTVKLGTGNGLEIHTQTSPTLAKIIHATNHRSVNLYAETLLKALTPKGSISAGLTKMKSHWSKQNIPLTGFHPLDGSGLSPRNSITPRQLALILKKSHLHKTGPTFTDSLPLAAHTGTLASFGRGTSIAGKVRAKSGGMSRVKSYAGYLTAKSGKRYAFALIANNQTASPKTPMTTLLSAIVREH